MTRRPPHPGGGSSPNQFNPQHSQLRKESGVIGYATSSAPSVSSADGPSGGAMNPPQPSYLDTTHPHMSTGSSYGALSQTTGAGAMTHYQQYPSQGNMPPAGSGPYAPTGSSYGAYYGSSVTSPQSAGGSTPASMGMQSLPSLGMYLHQASALVEGCGVPCIDANSCSSHDALSTSATPICYSS